MIQAFRRNAYSTIVLRVADASAARTAAGADRCRPAPGFGQAKPELTFYAEQSEALANFIASSACRCRSSSRSAPSSAMITMFAAVAQRTAGSAPCARWAFAAARCSPRSRQGAAAGAGRRRHRPGGSLGDAGLPDLHRQLPDLQRTGVPAAPDAGDRGPDAGLHARDGPGGRLHPAWRAARNAHRRLPARAERPAPGLLAGAAGPVAGPPPHQFASANRARRCASKRAQPGIDHRGLDEIDLGRRRARHPLGRAQAVDRAHAGRRRRVRPRLRRAACERRWPSGAQTCASARHAGFIRECVDDQVCRALGALLERLRPASGGWDMVASAICACSGIIGPRRASVRVAPALPRRTLPRHRFRASIAPAAAAPRAAPEGRSAARPRRRRATTEAKTSAVVQSRSSRVAADALA